MNEIQEDLNKKQNLHIIEVINLNTIFIYSDNDQMIPDQRFKQFALNFAKKCNKKNKPKMFNCRKKHGSRR